ncbi:MAG: phosphotransferase [Alphaproteobacteria bacterium]
MTEPEGAGDPRARAAGLPFWRGTVEPQPLAGGITNANFTVEDAGEKYVVRIAGDIPVHHVLQFNVSQACLAAHAAGLSPEVVYAEPGAIVSRFIAGKTFEAPDVRDNLERVLALVQRCHREVPRHLRGPVLVFWVFHVIRDYGHRLNQDGSRMAPEVPRLLDAAEALERAVGPIEPTFCHNDLLAANFMDDGRRLWLIDWDYAGFNSALFDLANLASNNELTEPRERWLLENYFDRRITDGLWRSYNAMKCASLLREAMWSMVSEIHSQLDFDYEGYTAENLRRFDRAYNEVRQALEIDQV